MEHYLANLHKVMDKRIKQRVRFRSSPLSQGTHGSMSLAFQLLEFLLISAKHLTNNQNLTTPALSLS